MGLIKALGGAAGSVLADTWKEVFVCDAMTPETMVMRGKKQTSGRSSNTKGNDNIITNGSGVIVADGQCMIIVDQGEIVEFTAEPGAFTYDASTEPSLFCGNLGKGIKDSFEKFKKRFTYGGDTGKDQRVYYFNTKEMVDRKFGTQNPVPFRVVDKNIGLDADVQIRCSGVYSFKMTDPILFYKNVSGNVTEAYETEKLDGQLKTEFVSALQPAFAGLSEKGLRPNEIPAHVDELCELLNTNLDDKWGQLRGLEVVSVALNPITLREEDQEMITTLQKAAAFKDPTMAAAAITEAQTEAMKNAASNEGGAMNGFVGMGMAMNAGSNNQNLYAMGQQQQQQAGGNSWTCKCGTVNTGNFCTNCGEKKPEAAAGAKFCPDCGTPLNGEKFCPNCGRKVGE